MAAVASASFFDVSDSLQAGRAKVRVRRNRAMSFFIKARGCGS
jgi:hypothetical protein